MFDLERAIAQWRRDMAEDGLRQPDILDELESHLRDHIEPQLRLGLTSEAAFDTAVQRLGRANLLNREFASAITLLDRLKDAVLVLAGIPNHNLVPTMNTSHPEPAWATYLKATTFVLPGILLAVFSAIFVVPKLQQICLQTGLPTATAGTFWYLTYSSIQAMLVMLKHGSLILAGAVLLLIVLEYRFKQWARYRRAAIGCGAFVLNSIVLFAFFMMFVASIVAAPAMAKLK